MGLYAKSPQQRMAEAEKERQLQEKIAAAKNPKPELDDDEFGGGFGGDDFGGDQAPTQAASGGFQSKPPSTHPCIETRK